MDNDTASATTGEEVKEDSNEVAAEGDAPTEPSAPAEGTSD